MQQGVKLFSLGEKGMDMDGNDMNRSEVNIDEKTWYEGGEEYWKIIAEKGKANMDGMLGGLTHVHDTDITESQNFMKLLNLRTDYVLDVGSGIGRVAEHLLAPIYANVDLLDINAEFLQVARTNFSQLPRNPLRNVFCIGLQQFRAQGPIYDLVWTQWVACYLTDPDFVTFLREAHKSLKPGGYLCFKENTTSKKSGDFIIDKEDSSVCRSDAHYQNLFSQVQDLFQLVAQQEQQWKGLLPVKMYALVKK